MLNLSLTSCFKNPIRVGNQPKARSPSTRPGNIDPRKVSRLAQRPQQALPQGSGCLGLRQLLRQPLGRQGRWPGAEKKANSTFFGFDRVFDSRVPTQRFPRFPRDFEQLQHHLGQFKMVCTLHCGHGAFQRTWTFDLRPIQDEFPFGSGDVQEGQYWEPCQTPE